MPDAIARKADGTGAMFSVGETPWHKEGTVLEKPPRSIEEALKIAGLDFEVGLKQVYFHDGYSMNEIPGCQASYRQDNGEVLGVVRSQYRPLQNRDAFRVLQPLLDSGKAVLETAGALRLGEDVWILVRFDLDDPVVQEVFADEVKPFGLLSNNHAGQRSVVLQETPIRVVCANTLSAAHRSAVEGKVFRVRHTVNVEIRTVKAAEALWGALIERYRVVAGQYRLLKRSFLKESDFQRLVLEPLSPIDVLWRGPGATTGQQKALERAMARRARLTALWSGGNGHIGDHTCWEAYNAVAEALDHDEDLWPSRDSRVASLFDGYLASAKQGVLDRLMRSAVRADRAAAP